MVEELLLALVGFNVSLTMFTLSKLYELSREVATLKALINDKCNKEVEGHG